MARLLVLALAVILLLPAPTVAAALLDPSPNPAQWLTMTGSGFRGAGYDKLIARAPRLAVGGFRVAFVVRTSTSASQRAGYLGAGEHTSGASVSVEATLAGVDVAAMQRITDQAYADFVAMLGEAGREVVPMEQVVAAPAYSKFEFAKATKDKPYFKSSGGRDYLILPPTGMSLWFFHGDPLGDKGPFALANAKALTQLSVDLGAVIISPSMVIDFAATKSSGRGGAFGGGRASAEVRPGMRLAGASMNAAYAREMKGSFPIDSDGGAATLEKAISTDEEFGAMVKAGDSTNKDVVQSFANLGLAIGPVRSKAAYILEADGPTYEKLASGLLRQAMNLFALSLRTGG